MTELPRLKCDTDTKSTSATQAGAANTLCGIWYLADRQLYIQPASVLEYSGVMWSAGYISRQRIITFLMISRNDDLNTRIIHPIGMAFGNWFSILFPVDGNSLLILIWGRHLYSVLSKRDREKFFFYACRFPSFIKFGYLSLLFKIRCKDTNILTSSFYYFYYFFPFYPSRR